MNDNDVFPNGVVIFFRLMGADGNLARSVLPLARRVMVGSRMHDAHEDDYVVADETGLPLGYFPRDFVSAILPLILEAPTHADSATQPARH